MQAAEPKAIPRAACLLPGMLALLLYARTAGYGFVWDDGQIFSDAAAFADWGSLWRWSTAPFLNFAIYFRPLALFGMGLEYQASGGAPGLLHAVSAALHAASAVMLTLLAMSLPAGKGAARRHAIAGLVAGLFYAIHPALIEGVSWISARFDLLTAFFGLAALLADRLLTRAAPRAVLGALAFLCAALCKEMILGLALLLPLWHLFTAPPGQGALATWRSQLAVYAAWFAAGLAYLALRAHFMPALFDTSVAASGALAERLPLVGKTLGRYLLLALWPFQLSSPVHVLVQRPGLADPECWLGFAAVAAAVAGVVAGRGLARGLALLGACFLLCLLPVSQLLPLTIGDSFAAERYLQLPMVFITLALALLVARLLASQGPRWMRPAALATLSVWLLLALLAQAKVVPAWKNADSLWPYAYQRAPLSKSVTGNLLSLFIEHGEADRGIAFAEMLRERQGGQLYPWQQINYAQLLAQKGRFDEALQYLLGAGAGMDPLDRVGQFKLHFIWGRVALGAGELDLAVEHFGKARAISPNDGGAAYFEGLALMAKGVAAQGRASLDRAYELAGPEYARQWRAAESANIRLAATRAAAKAAARAPRSE